MRTVVPFCVSIPSLVDNLSSTWMSGMVVPFCVSIPSLVDNLSNTWMNGMLMQMLDPAALTVLGNEIQAYYELLCLLLTIPK